MSTVNNVIREVYLNLVGKHAKELRKKSSRILVKIHVVAGKDLLEELGLF